MIAEIGKKYRHYKGNEYLVHAIALHSETHEEMVVYEALYESKEFGNHTMWVRPRGMFEEKIDVGGVLVDRFTML